MYDYLPVLVFMAIGLGIGIAFYAVNTAGSYLGVVPNNPGTTKNSGFECGFDAFDDARIPFDIRFYLVAILFIIFDLETAFLFPWAVAFKSLPLVAVLSMVFFLTVLTIGFIYEWYTGALEWE